MRLILAIALFPLLTPVPASPQDSIPAATTPPSSRSLAGVLLGRLPVDEPRHAFPLIAGVVLRTSSIGIDTRPVLLIRGGRRGAMNVYVDGAPLRFQTLGSAGIGPAINAIDDVTVITGVAAPELWDVGGGALVYTTRTGGARWGGDVRWDSDEPFGNAYTVGYNRIEGSAGGPIGVRTTVFASATLQGQRSAYRGPGAASVPTYVLAGPDTTVTDGFGGQTTLPLFAQWSGECDAAANGGVECQGLRRPFDWSSARRIQAKVEHRYGGGRLSVTGLGGELQHRFFPGQSALNPALYEGRRAWSAAAIVNWRHELGALRGAPLALDVNLSVVGHRDRSGPLEPDVEIATRDPYLGIAFTRLRFLGADVVDLPVTGSLIRDLRTNSGTRGIPFFGNPNEAFQAHRGNPYGLGGQGWTTGGLAGTLADVSERRLQGRLALVWRAAMHEVTIGVEGEQSEISSYSSPLLRQINTDVFSARPGRLGVFVGDRLVVARRTVIHLGVRVDRINPGGVFPNTPAYVSSSGPAYWNPSAATDDTAYANSVARVFHRGAVRGAVSPRIRFAHNLSQRAVMHLGYTRSAELPAWRTYYALTNSDLSFTNVSQIFGRDIKFVVSSLIEVGVRSSVGAEGTLGVSLYRKDFPDYVGRIAPFRDPRDTSRILSISALTAFEDAQAEGLEVDLGWRSGWLEGSAAYSMVRAHASGAFPGSENAVVGHALTLGGTLRGSEMGVLSGFEAAVLLRAQSGAPYTALTNNGSGTVVPFGGGGTVSDVFATSSLPWITRLDLRVAKAVRLGGREWSVYLDARNVLNARNLVALFGETGATANAFHRALTIGDPSIPSGEYLALRFEAQDAGALEPDGTTVNLTACSVWGNPVNCVALTRVERRFGDGNGFYTMAEQERAFNAYYEDFFGAWRFSAPGRTLRVGISLGL